MRATFGVFFLTLISFDLFVTHSQRRLALQSSLDPTFLPPPHESRRFPQGFLHCARKTQIPRPTRVVHRGGLRSRSSLFSSGKARRHNSRSSRNSRNSSRVRAESNKKRVCREMPPLRLNLPERAPRPAVADGTVNADNDAGARVGRSSAVVGAGTLGQAPFPGAWPTWPLLVMNTVHATVKGWFYRLDAALLRLPRGVGPAVSSLVRNTEKMRERCY